MDFSWTPEQLELRQRIIEFARNELNDDLRTRDRECEFPYDAWKKCAAFGLLGLAIPTEYGGQGGDIMMALAGMEGLGYGCHDNGLTLALNAQMWTTQLSLLSFGTEEQKRTYLPRLCGGDCIAAHAITETEAGSDAYSLNTVAERRGPDYVLNGSKTLVTLAPVADVVMVFANAQPAKGRWGVTVFLVDGGTPGLQLGPTQEKMGLRTVPMGQLTLSDCLVPESARLGPEGAGMAISNNSLEWERSCMLASQLGALERQLEATIRHARLRRQFDRPIGKFQAVSHRIAEMKLGLESARLMIHKVAWLKANGRPATMEAALAKLCLTEAALRANLDAIRIHGGTGYLTETGVERGLRDAIGAVLYGGTSDIQRETVARLLGL